MGTIDPGVKKSWLTTKGREVDHYADLEKQSNWHTTLVDNRKVRLGRSMVRTNNKNPST